LVLIILTIIGISGRSSLDTKEAFKDNVHKENNKEKNDIEIDTFL
jgi:hypothetical protein